MIKFRGINIDKKSLWMLFLFIPYIKLPNYVVGNTFNNFIDLWKILSFFILIIMIIKKNRVSLICLLFFIFEFIMLYSTMRTSDYSTIWAQFVQTISVVGVVLFSDYYITLDCKRFFSVVSKYICFLSFVNSISMFVYYPTGMFTDGRLDSNYYFLHLDNIAFFTVYIGLITLIIHSILKYKKITWAVMLFILFTFISYFYVNSTTAYFSMILLFIGSILVNRLYFKLNYNFCIIGIGLFCLGICVFHIQYYFKFFIVDVLHKRLDLTNRRWIWDKTISYIKQQPFIGYGLEFGKVMELKIGFNHIHNIFLEIVYKGGIASLAAFGSILFTIGNRMKKIKKEKIYHLLCLFLVLYLFICQFDYYNDIYVGFLIYVVLYHAPLISKTLKESS